MKEESGFNALIARLDSETDQIDENVRLLIRRLWEWGIERIFDDAVRKSVSNYFEARVPYQFFISPGTTSARDHVRWHNKPGGIVLHIIESCILCDIFLNSFGFLDMDKQIRRDTREVRDIVLAATLISDTQKRGMPWSGETVRSHGEIAAGAWGRVAVGCGVSRDFIDKISEASTWHYGKFTPSDEPRELLELPDYVQIVHLADSISSNRILGFIYNSKGRIPPPPKES